MQWMDLWLAIVLSGVGVFVVSSVVHMILPIHKGDWGQLPGEEQVLEAMRAGGINPGQYMFPWCGSMKDLGKPEVVEKYNRGPVGHMTVLPPGPMKIGKSLLLWFLYSLLVGVLVAYVASHTLKPDASYLTVFRITGTVAFAGYAIGVLNDSIWKGQRWGVTLKFVFDGVLYALVTAGVFAWQGIPAGWAAS